MFFLFFYDSGINKRKEKQNKKLGGEARPGGWSRCGRPENEIK